MTTSCLKYAAGHMKLKLTATPDETLDYLDNLIQDSPILCQRGITLQLSTALSLYPYHKKCNNAIKIEIKKKIFQGISELAINFEKNILSCSQNACPLAGYITKNDTLNLLGYLVRLRNPPKGVFNEDTLMGKEEKENIYLRDVFPFFRGPLEKFTSKTATPDHTCNLKSPQPVKKATRAHAHETTNPKPLGIISRATISSIEHCLTQLVSHNDSDNKDTDKIMKKCISLALQIKHQNRETSITVKHIRNKILAFPKHYNARLCFIRIIHALITADGKKKNSFPTTVEKHLAQMTDKAFTTN